MQVFSFIAENAAAALEQIQARLGPEAVVLNVRQASPRGMARLWPGWRRIEVLAGVPDEASAGRAGVLTRRNDRLSDFPRGLSEYSIFNDFTPGQQHWRTIKWLESMGLQPECADQLQTHLNAAHGDNHLPELESEWAAVSGAFVQFWQVPPPLDDLAAPRPHVFIGPPGSGKTTVLCKWLTLGVLTEEHAGRVWRLDGGTANTSEFLAIHCEMLDVPMERFWSRPDAKTDLQFVDLPGVDAGDAQAIAGLREQLAALPSPHVHLVLNAAYEMQVLQAHWQAFSQLEPEDLIFTHLDEERRRVKLWNFVFGTNCCIRFLSAGQKIPGEFRRAVPELLFPEENAR